MSLILAKNRSSSAAATDCLDDHAMLAAEKSPGQLPGKTLPASGSLPFRNKTVPGDDPGGRSSNRYAASERVTIITKIPKISDVANPALQAT
ncbi:hypothetical protein [Planctomycetes bacterium SV_7m_r]|uniref:hypothetical protein n=1 Tax=Stieleria bergensis TaxID=2528025 RepID=UPI0011A470C9